MARRRPPFDFDTAIRAHADALVAEVRRTGNTAHLDAFVRRWPDMVAYVATR